MKRLRVAVLSSVLVFTAAFLPVLTTLSDYGPHWDAGEYLDTAVRFSRGFRGADGAPPLSEIDTYFQWDRGHPPLSKILTGVTHALFYRSLGRLDSARVAVGLFYAGTVTAVFLTLRRVFTWRAGLFGAFLLAWTPRLFCHAHLLSLDVPISFWFFAAVMSFPLCIEKVSGWFVSGALLGLALLSKYQATFIPIVWFIWLVWEGILSRDRLDRAALKHLGAGFTVASVVGALIFLLGWPYFWRDYPGRVSQYVKWMLSHSEINVYYLGKVYKDPEVPPWHYVIVMIGVTTSLALLIPGLPGLVSSFRRSAPKWARIAAVGLSAPVMIFMFPSVKKFDGVRMLLPVFPFLAFLAGYAYDVFEKWVVERTSRVGPRRFVVGLPFLLPLFAGYECVAYHPYQIVYYNQLVGGFSGAYRRGFDADYLGLAVSRCHSYLNEHARPGSIVFLAGANTRPYFSPIRYDKPGKGAKVPLRPDVRVLNFEHLDYFIGSQSPMFLVVNSRRGGLRSDIMETADREIPDWDLKFQNVPLVRVYKLKDRAGRSDPALRDFGPVEAIEVHNSTAERTLSVVWRWKYAATRGNPGPDLVLVVGKKNPEGEAETVRVINQLCPILSTKSWLPGDVVRSTYRYDLDEGPGEIVFGVMDVDGKKKVSKKQLFPVEFSK